MYLLGDDLDVCSAFVAEQPLALSPQNPPMMQGGMNPTMRGDSASRDVLRESIFRLGFLRRQT
jgi:hypothetical protein